MAVRCIAFSKLPGVVRRDYRSHLISPMTNASLGIHWGFLATDSPKCQCDLRCKVLPRTDTGERLAIIKESHCESPVASQTSEWAESRRLIREVASRYREIPWLLSKSETAAFRSSFFRRARAFPKLTHSGLERRILTRTAYPAESLSSSELSGDKDVLMRPGQAIATTLIVRAKTCGCPAGSVRPRGAGC